MKIEIRCNTLDWAMLNELVPFQGNFKTLDPMNYEKLKAQIVSNGFISPFFVWHDGSALYLLDGHQRHTAINLMGKEGFILPTQWPIVKIQADTFKQAKKMILALSSQYGTITKDGLNEFISDSEIDFNEMVDEFNFDALDFEEMAKDKFNEDIQPPKIDHEENVTEKIITCPACKHQFIETKEK